MKNFKLYSIAALVASFLFYLIGVKSVIIPLLIVSAVCFVLFYLFGREKNSNDTDFCQHSRKKTDYTATTWWYMENNDVGDCGGA